MKKLLGNKIVMAGGLAVVAGIVFMFVLRPMLFGSESKTAAEEPASGAPAGAAAHGGATSPGTAATAAAHQNPGPTYQLKDRILNLNGTPRHYLKLGLALEFKAKSPAFYKLAGEARAKADEEFALELAPKAPAIEDAITTLVGAKSQAQISTPAGQAELKRELLERIAQVVGEPELVNVYFTQFVTQ